MEHQLEVQILIQISRKNIRNKEMFKIEVLCFYFNSERPLKVN